MLPLAAGIAAFISLYAVGPPKTNVLITIYTPAEKYSLHVNIIKFFINLSASFTA